MFKLENKFCEIICFDPKNIPFLNEEYKKYQIGIREFFSKDEQINIPTLIIGWEYVQNTFEKTRISKKKIAKNLYWTFSQKEDKESFEEDIKKFIEKSIKEFLPNNYQPLDFLINDNNFDFLNKYFSTEINFVFFDCKNALYVYNQNFFFGINLDSLKYTKNNLQEFIIYLFKNYKLIFFNYDNIPDILKKDNNFILTLENVSWICNNYLLTETDLFKFSPTILNEKFYVFLMFKLYENIKCDFLNNENILKRYSKKDHITYWLSNQILHFQSGNKLILKYSNKRTITGRINCSDKRFNPQLLPKNSPVRKEIISQYKNGKIVVFDYVAFETKLSVYLTKNENFISEISQQDIHEKTAQLLFKTQIINSSQRKIGKQINHSIIYGIGNERLKNVFEENNIDTNSIEEIKNFLKPIIDNSKIINQSFKKHGYIINPYNTIIYPNKDWATYNNFIQSTAADIVVDKLEKIKNKIEKNKSNFLYQVYDSFVFDIHPDEINIIEEIKLLLEKTGKYIFDVEYTIGSNLWECTKEKLEEIDQII